MGLFSRKKEVDVALLEARLGAVVPWQGTGLSVTACLVRTGMRRKGAAPGVEVRAGDAVGVFTAAELLAVFKGMTPIAETFVDSPQLLFFCRADAGGKGSSAYEAFASLPDGSYALAGADEPMSVFAQVSPQEVPQLEGWLRALPGL